MPFISHSPTKSKLDLHIFLWYAYFPIYPFHDFTHKPSAPVARNPLSQILYLIIWISFIISLCLTCMWCRYNVGKDRLNVFDMGFKSLKLFILGWGSCDVINDFRVGSYEKALTNEHDMQRFIWHKQSLIWSVVTRWYLEIH